MTQTSAERAAEGMRKMLRAAMDQNAEIAGKVLAAFGFAKNEDVPGTKLFEVCEKMRAEFGFPTAFMIANAKVEKNGLTVDPSKGVTIASQINTLAHEFYARAADVELNPHAPVNGKPVQFGDNAKESNADFLDRLNRQMLGQ